MAASRQPDALAESEDAEEGTAYMRGSLITLHVPYTGERELWGYQPVVGDWPSWKPEAKQHRISIEVSRPADQIDRVLRHLERRLTTPPPPPSGPLARQCRCCTLAAAHRTGYCALD